jgi:hypothetical protein
MIFKKFDSTDIVVGRVNQVSSPMWTSGDIAALQSAFYTSPSQTVATGSGIFNVYNGLYYNNVYYSGEPFFAVAYGNYYGSGSSQTDIDTSRFIQQKQFIVNMQMFYCHPHKKYLHLQPHLL